jgi:hypothetical protein
VLSHYRVFAALHDEAREGWVWLPSTPILVAGHIRIRNPRNGRTIVCEMRVADANFRKVYGGQGATFHLPGAGDFIVISDWYRRLLGILDTQNHIPLEIEDANSWWLRYVVAFVRHPSPAIRTSIVLGLISLAFQTRHSSSRNERST